MGQPLKATKLPVTPSQEAGKRAAIEAAGSMRQLARELGIDVAGISRWKRVPAEWCRPINQLYGVPLHVLRPDLWREDDGKAVA